jgi:hypothetical protein
MTRSLTRLCFVWEACLSGLISVSTSSQEKWLFNWYIHIQGHVHKQALWYNSCVPMNLSILYLWTSRSCLRYEEPVQTLSACTQWRGKLEADSSQYVLECKLWTVSLSLHQLPCKEILLAVSWNAAGCKLCPAESEGSSQQPDCLVSHYRWYFSVYRIYMQRQCCLVEM